MSFTVLSSKAFAAQVSNGENQSCEQNTTVSNNQKCTDAEKRSELKALKLSPKIRIENTKPDNEFNLNELIPFIGGSGTIGGSSKVD